MALKAVCCFTHLTSTDYVWYDPHFCVKKFVDALKFREINSSAWIPVGSDGTKRKLEQANASDAVDWFGEMAAEILATQDFQQRPVLVPYPSSKCTPEVAISRTRRLADAIAIRFEADVADIIRYRTPRPSAHEEGGTREADLIYLQLVLTGPIDRGRPYVLVDDVLTTGEHARAGAAILRTHGAHIEMVVCGVKATKAPVPDHFSRVWLELDEYIPRQDSPANEPKRS
jgi:pyrimidine operon attenuation protein/uracil phosphoribosyltransferase